MSEEQTSIHAEDLPLDESDAEAVVGGAKKHHRMTIAQAEKAGWKEIACGTGGSMLMENGRGQQRVFYR